MEKYCTAGQATNDNVAHAYFTLDTQGYKHTLSEHVILIAFLLQQWLQEHVSGLSYTHIACLFLPSFLFHFGAFSSVCSLPLRIFLSIFPSSFFIPTALCRFLMRDRHGDHSLCQKLVLDS
jgi:hypothetical protein